VLSEFFVTVRLSIDSEKVTEIDGVKAMFVELSAGFVETTEGGIPSTTIALFVPRELEAPGEGSVSVA
jgi:hypothetical protein